jgi:hypothetical protein
MGSADLHGQSALLPMYTIKNKYMMIGIKKRVFLCRFQKSLTFLCEKMSPKKGKYKKTAASLCHAVFVIRHTISQRICHPSCYFVAYSSSVLLFYACQICVITKA